MKLKTTNKIVLEQAIQHKDNLIELVGCKNLCECDIVIDNLVKQNKICDKKNTFAKNFGFNSKFYYKISHRKNLEYLSCEIGLGYLEKKEDRIYLKRISTVLAIENNQLINTYGSAHNFKCDCHEEGMLLISSYNPVDMMHLLIDKNCIISSIEAGVASPVYVNKNSIVGRLNGNVESISIPSLLNQIIKYEDGKVKFYNGSRWINLVEEKDENTK
jgi:hypothetical protein